MERYLWGPDGDRWEIVYHPAVRMWEVVEFDDFPFSLRYARLSGVAEERCRLCDEPAEPAVFLRDPESGAVFLSTGPVCLDCACGNRAWHTIRPTQSPRG